jgi:hypothetical protein
MVNALSYLQFLHIVSVNCIQLGSNWQVRFTITNIHHGKDRRPKSSITFSKAFEVREIDQKTLLMLILLFCILWYWQCCWHFGGTQTASISLSTSPHPSSCGHVKLKPIYTWKLYLTHFLPWRWRQHVPAKHEEHCPHSHGQRLNSSVNILSDPAYVQ